MPFAPTLLKGMDWAALSPAEASVRGVGGYSAVVPPGSILPYVGAQCPPGFLPCDGRAIPRTLFPKLYEAIGDAYGTGRIGFRVPDLRGSVRPEAARRSDMVRSDTTAGFYSQPGFGYVIRT